MEFYLNLEHQNLDQSTTWYTMTHSLSHKLHLLSFSFLSGSLFHSLNFNLNSFPESELFSETVFPPKITRNRLKPSLVPYIKCDWNFLQNIFSLLTAVSNPPLRCRRCRTATKSHEISTERTLSTHLWNALNVVSHIKLYYFASGFQILSFS